LDPLTKNKSLASVAASNQEQHAVPARIRLLLSILDRFAGVLDGRLVCSILQVMTSHSGKASDEVARPPRMAISEKL
jgi:hypothetical protein